MAATEKADMQAIIRFIDGWRPRRVLVVGDVMLDHQVFGNAERLSPDAPVPVLQFNHEAHQPGGAANVATCLRGLNCDVSIVGVVGDDASGGQLREALLAGGCDVSGLVVDDSRPTIVKRSFIGLAQHRHPQKMFRVDYEDRSPVGDAIAERVLAAVRRQLDDVAVLCIEDYNKGLLGAELTQQLIAAAKQRGVPVLVDPAAIGEFAKYRGCTCITPNRTEGWRATGAADHADDLQVARDLASIVEADYIALTLDRDGVLLLPRDGQAERHPTMARRVYDVSGAGDMVLAALAGSIANGANWPLAVDVANVAAGLEVEKSGVAAVSLDEMLVFCLQSQHAGSKLRGVDALKTELRAWRSQGRKVAFTNGCFDILHAGHVEMLRGARATADLLVVAVNSDASIRALKGPERPIVDEQDRIHLLSELACVDYLILFGDGGGGEADTPKPLLRELKPDVLVKGGQYAHNEVVGWEIVESYGGQVQTIPHVQGRSTTNIVDRIRGES